MRTVNFKKYKFLMFSLHLSGHFDFFEGFGHLHHVTRFPLYLSLTVRYLFSTYYRGTQREYS